MLQRPQSPRILSFVIGWLAMCAPAFSQVCSVSATAIPVHAEGYAEPVSNLTVSCNGGTAGATVSLTMFVSLNTPITNRLDSNGQPVGITLTGATGSFALSSASTINLNAVNYTVPPDP